MSHADASPSSSGIWLNCPASVTQARGKIRRSTTYTREGTAAHVLAEEIIRSRGQMSGDQYIEIDGEMVEVTEEMQDAAQLYAGIVLDLEKDATDFGVECKVTVPVYGEDIYGTLDAFAYRSPRVTIADLKMGVNPVSPDCSQLKLYALGVIDRLGPFAKVTDVHAIVVQPRAGGVKTHTYSLDELIVWERDILTPAVAKLAAGDATENPGSHCRWCVRAGECRAFAAAANAVARTAFDVVPPDPHGFTDAELGDILDRAELVAAWVAKVRAEASARIDNGGKVPGWKLVAGRSMRKLDDYANPTLPPLTQALAEAGVPLAAVTRPETLGAIERAMKKAKVPSSVLDPYITRTTPGSTLVPENSSRPSIATGAKVFSIEIVDEEELRMPH